MNNKAKAAIFAEINQPFVIKEYELTPPESGYVLLELVASGVCGTDVHIHRGKLGIEPPKIIGHEFVGQIAEISEADSVKYKLNNGDYVISDIAVPCGECALCKSGDDANCVNMTVTNGGDPEVIPHFHGGYAEFNYSPAANLIKIPEGVNPKAAAAFACPGPTVLHAISLANQSGYDFSNTNVVVIQGAGPVGCFAVMYFASLGIKHIAVINKIYDEKKEELIRKLGATEFLYLDDMTDEEVKSYIKNISGLIGADVVFESSGNPKAIPLGMELLRNRGVYLVPGQYSNSGGIEIQPQLITFKALNIIGSSQYSIKDVVNYTKFLDGKNDLQQLILSLVTCYKVEDINTAFDDIKHQKNIKTMLVK